MAAALRAGDRALVTPAARAARAARGEARTRRSRVIARALAEEGPLTRPEARERVEAAGVELNTQTGMHIVGLAVISGIACLGPDRGRQTCLVRREDWLGKPPPFDRERALAELARRYLRRLRARDRSGLRLLVGAGRCATCAPGCEAISGEIEEVRVGDEAMLVPRGAPAAAARATGQVRMLGNFDTYLLGWKDRAFSVTGEHADPREGGRRGLDPAGDRRGRDRGRRLALGAQGRAARDLAQPAEGGARAARRGDRGRDRGHRPLRGRGGHDL